MTGSIPREEADRAFPCQAMPIHPGEVLREEFMEPLGLSANRLAQAIGVPTHRITAILNGDRGITGETAILLGRALGTTPEFWLNLQSRYEATA